MLKSTKIDNLSSDFLQLSLQADIYTQNLNITEDGHEFNLIKKK